MQSFNERIGTASANGGRIKPVKIRDLYYSFCDQVIRFSAQVQVEAAPFETRFSGPAGMRITVSPYRDLFMVSIGEISPYEIRVTGDDSYFRALDLSLVHYLESSSCAANN